MYHLENPEVAARRSPCLAHDNMRAQLASVDRYGAAPLGDALARGLRALSGLWRPSEGRPTPRCCEAR